jgi:hypothetical protein
MVGEISESTRVSPSDDSEQFSAALGRLKEAGCVVLVTGAVDETVRAATSRRLFGTPQLSRQRIVVHADDTALQPASYLPHGIAPDSTSVQLCEWNSLDRSEAEGNPDESLSSAENTLEHPTELVACSGRLARLIADSEPASNEFAPGEIRVGVLTLSSILEQHGQAATEAFLSSFGRQVQNHHGLVHCHLPMKSESATATALASTVDIHIHLRDQNGYPPEQRWYLCETDCFSEWMPLLPTR